MDRDIRRTGWLSEKPRAPRIAAVYGEARLDGSVFIGNEVFRPADPLAHDDTGAGVKLAVALAAASLGMNVAMIALLFWR